jgi:hypothetical protein
MISAMYELGRQPLFAQNLGQLHNKPLENWLFRAKPIQ